MCTQALAFIEFPVDNVTRQGFIISLAVRHFVKLAVIKMLRQQKTVKIFNS
jgi:hypothetical protein